jgi:hypothetical protein
VNARKYSRGSRRPRKLRSTRGDRQFRSAGASKTGCLLLLLAIASVAFIVAEHIFLANFRT